MKEKYFLIDNLLGKEAAINWRSSFVTAKVTQYFRKLKKLKFGYPLITKGIKRSKRG